MEAKFYKCNHCGNILIPAIDAGVTPSCCGEPMELLKAGVSDGAAEKHVPVVEREGDGSHFAISIGSVPHPMTEEHAIQFVVLLYGSRTYMFKLEPGEEPKVRCTVKDNSLPVTVYEYCNLHGLWKADF